MFQNNNIDNDIDEVVDSNVISKRSTQEISIYPDK